MAEKTYLQAISDGLRQEMRRDKRVFVIGEDVGVYGGAFKVTQGFQEEFGPWRVIDAPLAGDRDRRRLHRRSDHGYAPGRRDAVRRLHLVRLGPPRHRGRQAALPRRNAGPDRRPPAPRAAASPAGPFHSQNPESSFAHIPGLKVVCPATPADAKGLLVDGHRGSEPRPLLRAQAPLPPDQGRGARRALHDPLRRGPRSIARATTSRSSHGAPWSTRPTRPPQKVVEEDGISVEILDLRTIIPWDKEAVLALGREDVQGDRPARGHAHGRLRRPRSQRRSPRRRSRSSTRPVRRITAPDTPVPFAPALEKAFIPQVDDVVAGLRELAAY